MPEFDAVVLVGHGGVPRDFPRKDLQRLKALEGERRQRGGPPSEEELRLERRIRTWPRTAANDPYRAGLESLAGSLRPLVAPARLVLAYNEFCAPALDEAVDELARGGARHIVVVPSMLTPGGIHSETEIPETISGLRVRYPEAMIHYAWPFDMEAVARLLASQVGVR